MTRIQKGITLTSIILSLSLAPKGFAEELKAVMQKATQTGPGEVVGVIIISQETIGTIFKFNLQGLPAGPHGVHVHEKGACEPTVVNDNPVPAGGAGGHWDKDKTGKHEGPQGQGHMGDLPLLEVEADGTAKQGLISGRIKDSNQLKGLAIIIHANGDNYSDQPAALGGGGGRIACGVIN